MSTSTPERVRPSKSNRSNGQWSVDGHEPLNANEVFKQADNGLNVRDRILNEYATTGFDSITEEDLHGRFRWWGLYTQRKQGLDGTHTGAPDSELEDKFFMMRIRLDGGQLTLDQLETLAGISRDFARGTADVSDRQNIQYHWIAIEDVPEIWRRIESVGLQTTEACGDVPRVVLGSPVAGVAKGELFDSSSTVREIVDTYIGDPSLSNLPRKFKTAVTAHPSLDVVHEINDVSFVGVEHPELGLGYDLWVGGGLSTAPRLAERVGVFVRPEEAAEVWHGVVSIFRDYGFRRLRNKARLKFLIAQWGIEKFREVLETEYLGRSLPDGPAAVPDGTPADHIGVHEQKDGRRYIGAAPIVGRLNGDILTGLAALAREVGAERIRLTPHQKVLLLDVAEEHVERAVAGLEELGLTPNPSPFRRYTMACTGIEFCKLSFVDTKAHAKRTILELEKRLDGLDLDERITLHINGCPNSCVRIQTADIGLKGLLMDDGEGGHREGFQVHLGGGLAETTGTEANLGRTVKGFKVPADDLPDYVEGLVRSYLDQRTTGETFAQWAHRAEEGDLK